MKPHRPHGPAPTAWEADILKIRAFEMVLVLFYLENLRQFIMGSIQATDRIHGADRLSDGKAKTKDAKKFDLARALLVSDGAITQAESDELHELVDYRNLIGHRLHELTADTGAYSDLIRRDPKTLKRIPAYDYTAAKRAKKLKEKVERGMRSGFILQLCMSPLQFEAAEKTYVAEIERLKKRVNSGIVRANGEIAEVNRIIRALPPSVMSTADPGHPQNLRDNGSLTTIGGRCAFQLFDASTTPLAVAYLMRISLRSASLWFKKWQASKG